MRTIYEVLGYSQSLVASEHSIGGNRKCDKFAHSGYSNRSLLYYLCSSCRDSEDSWFFTAYCSCFGDNRRRYLSCGMGQPRSSRVLREHKQHIQARDLRTVLVRISTGNCSSTFIIVFLFEFLRISGESGLVSDLNVQRHRRIALEKQKQERVAYRLAHPSSPSKATPDHHQGQQHLHLTTAPDENGITTVEKVVQSATENVPLSPNPREPESNDIIRDLPKCLMQAHGNVFD